VSLPLFTSLRGYARGWLNGDLVAGLTVWAVLVPESLAYATIAGVSPVVGLYAAPGALILCAAFGSSKHVITGPMAATAALSAAAVADLVTGGLSGDPDEIAAFTIALALMVGVLALLAGVLRFAVVHDVGQVRDVIAVEPGNDVIPVYPSVEAALQALGAG
jgi:sulfate permease, SulP family